MNNEKAKEYFSAYSEGTLDAGLAQSFEAKLNADANLKAEYEQFESTLKELESLRFEKIEAPFDLNEKISAAVDRSLYEKKRAATPSWTMWLRNTAFAGLAAAALFGAYYTINLKGGGPVDQAGVGGGVTRPVKSTVQPSEQIEYSKHAHGVGMSYKPSEKHTVLIKGGSEGEKTVDVDNSGWLNELKNDQQSSAIFTIEVKGEIPPTIVVVPGTVRAEATTGQGNLVDLARAMADHFGVPVVVRSTNIGSELAWDFSSGKASQSASDALKGLPYSADLRESGVLSITDH